MALKRFSSAEYIEGVLKGDRVMLSRAITLVESIREDDRRLAREVVQGCLPHAGGSYRIGITGVPGVGKSTFIDAFGTFLTSQGKKVAVLAIDPSSSLTRGSILGDKTRMERLSMDRNAYIRPSPTGGSLGGVARKTRETLLLCEAAGYDVVLVETVGVGQSEVAVNAMVDAFMLLMLPNAGDELQGIKKGIMEMADLVVINKADGESLPKARAAKAVFSQALRLFPHSPSGWRPPVLLCSAVEERGIEEVWQQLLQYQETQQAGSWWVKQREEQALQWMEDTLRYRLFDAFFEDPRVAGALPGLREEVIRHQRSPIEAAEELLRIWKSQE